MSHTIARVVEFDELVGLPACRSRQGIHTGCEAQVRLIPSETSGIRFRRADLPGSPVIPANPDYLHPSERNTTLQSDAATVMTIEHFMAACWLLDITALDVEIRGEELPSGDGSAVVWMQAFESAKRVPIPGSTVQSPARTLAVKHDDAEITLAPSGGTSVTFCGVFPDADEYAVTWLPSTDPDELAGARTFCRLSEVIFLRERGLIRGGRPDNALVWMDVPVTEREAELVRSWWPDATLRVTPEGFLDPQRLRWPDEPARHKLLDLLGDLALARPLPSCTVKARQTGHSAAHELVREIWKNRRQ